MPVRNPAEFTNSINYIYTLTKEKFVLQFAEMLLAIKKFNISKSSSINFVLIDALSINKFDAKSITVLYISESIISV